MSSERPRLLDVSPVSGGTRLARAAVLGATCLLLALTGHVLAGGAAPSVGVVLVLAVPVACLSVLVTGGRGGALRIGAVLAVTQVGLHEAFMLTTQGHCAPVANALAAHAHGRPGAAERCMAAMPMAGPSFAMIAAHAAAAVATGLVLWQGERLLWAFLTWLAATLPGAPLRLALRTAYRGTPAVRRVAGVVALPGGVGRRGPPTWSAA
jgi:hypothetical protein